jgi:hypothetical protein
MPVLSFFVHLLTVLLTLVRVEHDPALAPSARILTVVEVIYYLLGVLYFLFEFVRAFV